jgi:hypothetical protein
MATKKELIRLLDSIPDDEEIAFGLWVIDDVYKSAKGIGMEVTKLEAESILKDVHNQQSADYGISWEDIEDALYNLKRRKK